MDTRQLVIAVTGGIGCGKSEVGRILQTIGWQVLDTDHVGHTLLERETMIWKQVVGHFGEDILGPDGDVDRKKLGRIVFEDDQQLQTLNGLLHPAIREYWQDWVKQQDEGQHAAVLIPLLFEVGETQGWDAIVCVSAPEDEVRRRLLQRGLSELDIAQRIQSQMALEEKERQSDFVITNDDSLDALKRKVEQVLESIQKETA